MIRRLFLLLWSLSLTGIAGAQINSDSLAIRQVMAVQEDAWNRADLIGFMEGYWKSDSLCFIGSKGLTYGWQATLDNYKKGYPDAAAMGRLRFSDVTVRVLSDEYAFVVGKWHLVRIRDELGGHYTLLWKKIGGKWLIVADHSS
jgi:ketosteroid isomerase-like protein